MTQQLAGKTAIVTGAGGGIGRATVLALASEGANIIGVGRHPDVDGALAKEVEELGGSYAHIEGDVRESSTAQAATARALSEFGSVDILVNNAGVGLYDDFVNSTEEMYDEIMDTSMKGTYLFTRSVVPSMIDQGSGLLVQIASQAGIQGFPRESMYCAAKHAQVGFSRALRRELQPHGIAVSVICPAAVKTKFAYGRGRDAEFLSHDEFFLTAEDIADTIVFLATREQRVRIPELGIMSIGEAL